MRVATVRLTTTTIEEVLVGIPDTMETKFQEGSLLVLAENPKSGPQRWVSLNVALQIGLLQKLETIPAPKEEAKRAQRKGASG